MLDISATEVPTTAGNADTLPPVAKTTSVPGQGISTAISFYFGISFLSKVFRLVNLNKYICKCVFEDTQH